MIIKVKKYVAKIARYIENEKTGNIAKVEEEVTISGQRISAAAVERQIPRECKLISHGYKTTAYEIDVDVLEDLLEEYGSPADGVDGAEA